MILCAYKEGLKTNNQLKILEKEFDNEKIRKVWDKEQEKYYISVVDIVSILTESKDGRKYWNKLKQRLKEEGNETVTNCHQLKLLADDGKMKLTDVVDIEGKTHGHVKINYAKTNGLAMWNVFAYS